MISLVVDGIIGGIGAPLGDPMEINVRGYELTLRKNECASIEMEALG